MTNQTDVESEELNFSKCDGTHPDYEQIQKFLNIREKLFGKGFAMCVNNLDQAKLQGSS